MQENCPNAEWVIVHDDDAVMDWKKALPGLLGNTLQYNLRCFYSPPRHELPMRLGRNHVSGKPTFDVENVILIYWVQHVEVTVEL